MNQELKKLSDEMDRLDDELFAAEKAGNISEQIALLYQRARGWYQFGELQRTAGRDWHTAIISAQRDETSARQLQDGAL
jgi:hypothetical protein